MSGLAQGDKLCEICRQPYRGPYRDPPSKPTPVSAGPAAAALRGATLMPQSLVQLAMSHRSEVSTTAARMRAGILLGFYKCIVTPALKGLCLCIFPQQVSSHIRGSDGSRPACSHRRLFCLKVCPAAEYH